MITILWHLFFISFYCQIGVEKKNDELRRYFHRKKNRWDAATNLLLVEKRQEVLREYEREKRAYVKRKTLREGKRLPKRCYGYLPLH